jgi:hypothetical protein
MPKGSSKPRWLEINNVIHQLLVYADDVNIGNVHTVNKKTEALIFVSKEINLKVNADKTKHTVCLEI